MEKVKIKAFIFDLDGVLVDTAKYHYTSWRRIANSLGFDFSESQNESLKGVSRKQSLEYLLRLGKIELDDVEKLRLEELKNTWYLDLISGLDETALLPGVLDLLKDLKVKEYKIALGSASKNAMPVLVSTGILQYFDFIADGNSTKKSKPDPDVFFIAAEGIKCNPSACLVIEDSEKGIEAAISGGFWSLGIGDKDILSGAHAVLPSLENVCIDDILEVMQVEYYQLRTN